MITLGSDIFKEIATKHYLRSGKSYVNNHGFPQNEVNTLVLRQRPCKENQLVNDLFLIIFWIVPHNSNTFTNFLARELQTVIHAEYAPII